MAANVCSFVPGPLAHLTILDLSRVLAGPWCTQLLADLGATVIKIERPGRGDDTRAWGPPFLVDREGRNTAEAAYYLACNRGKQSVAIDFTQPEGRELVAALARQSDALVENFKVGTLARHALDYESLAKENPRLVYASITGFGQDGPYAARAGYDFIVQAMSGFMSITGERDGVPGGGPQKAGIAITDLMTGMYAATGILAALAERERTGRGRWVDACLFDSAVAMMSVVNMNYLVGGVVPRREGNAHANIVPYQAFACADGPLIVAVGNDGQFARFCEIAGHVEWAQDARFATNAGRVRHRGLLAPMIGDAMRSRGRAEWLAAFEAAAIPAGPINDIAQVFADPQVVARKMRIDVPHPLAGSLPQVRMPLAFPEVVGGTGASPMAEALAESAAVAQAGAVVEAPAIATPASAPPLLGEHTVTVLRERLGLEAPAIANLAARGIVGIGSHAPNPSSPPDAPGSPHRPKPGEAP